MPEAKCAVGLIHCLLDRHERPTACSKQILTDVTATLLAAENHRVRELIALFQGILWVGSPSGTSQNSTSIGDHIAA